MSHVARPLSSAVIVSAARTPIGSIGSSLAALTAPQLGAAAVAAAVRRAAVAGGVQTGAQGSATLEAEEVEFVGVQEAFLGNVVSSGIGQAPTRQAVLGAGLPLSVPCTGVNKVCASGLKAVALAAALIDAGHVSSVIAGGMESMSNIPYYLPGVRPSCAGTHTCVTDDEQMLCFCVCVCAGP